MKPERLVFLMFDFQSHTQNLTNSNITVTKLQKRAKLNVPTPTIPMEARVEKALDAIYVCCFGRDPIEEEDERTLNIMLKVVFPSVSESDIANIIREKAKRVAEGGEEDRYSEPKLLSKEAVQLQMKDLQFLQQNNDS